jgi:hypothetical protein
VGLNTVGRAKVQVPIARRYKKALQDGYGSLDFNLEFFRSCVSCVTSNELVRIFIKQLATVERAHSRHLQAAPTPASQIRHRH